MEGSVTVPSKPKKPCAYPGCPALVTGRYCEEYARKANSDYEKYGRDKNTKRRYGCAWKAVEYFNVGIKKMRRLAEDNEGEFAIYMGNRYLVIRERFEQYIVQLKQSVAY